MFYLFIVFSFLIFSVGVYYKNNISYLSIEDILYTLTNSLDGADYSVYFKIFKYIFYAILLAIIVILIFKRIKSINNFIYNHKLLSFLMSFTLLIFAALFDLYQLDFLNFIIKNNTRSIFYSENYKSVSLEDIKGTNTNNLIYIYLESMDTYYLDGENDAILSELIELAEENTNFSPNDGVGGSYTIFGGKFTIASMYCQSFGLPLYNGIDSDTKGFTSEIIGLGDILSQNNYIQEFMCGSDASFANTDSFFLNHGFEKVYDLDDYEDSENNINNERNSWGLPDYLLFDVAKSELTNLAETAESLNKNFNFTIATIDCHYPDGYKCSKCLDEYENEYRNIYACQSRNVYDFINWIKEQDFYENTTIVISGDHLNFDISRMLKSDCTVYDCIINSRAETNNAKNRLFSVCDLFPTTLASLGFELEDNRMGIGTNLFSNKKTVFEEYGVKYVNDEICKLWEG